MADFVLRHADWKGGDYGVVDPSRADADTFSGINLYPYSSGLLGVRAGAKTVPVTGLPNHTAVPGPRGFWAWGTQLVIVLGNTPYQFPQTGGPAVAWAPYPSPPIFPVTFLTGKGIPYSLADGVLYKHPNTTTTTAITTPAPLSIIVRWGYFMVGVDKNVPWRLWFSLVDAAGTNFDSWPANNFLDIGDTEAITALVPIFNTLYVGKVDGWRAVSGVLGTLASVRDVTVGNGPTDQRLTTASTDNRIIYWGKEDSPVWFNGERVSIVDEQERSGSTYCPCAGVVVTPTSQRVILTSEGPDETTDILSWSDSAWTRHNIPLPLGGIVPSQVRDGDSLPPDVVFAVVEPTTAGDPVKVLSYNHALDRPGHADDEWSAPGDGGGPEVSGSVSFPSYWEPIGRQVRVRSIIVQFRKWDCGKLGAENEMRLRVNSLGSYSRGSVEGSEHRWLEACERSSVDGSDDSWRVNVGDQGYGNGFQVTMPHLVGVALREVVILCDVRTERV